MTGLAAAGALLASFAAHAETDMRKVKCEDFTAIMQSKDHQQEVAGALILGFLWGFYKEDNEPAVAGTAADTAKLAKLAKYCTENPSADIISTADKLWDKK